MNEDSSVFSPTLNTALRFALEHLSSLEQAPVAAAADLQQLRHQLSIPLDENGVNPVQVVEDLVRSVQGGIVGTAGGRFFGWVVGGAMPASLAADWLTSAWDQNASLYAAAPAAAVAEETAGRWLKEVLRLPASASYAMVTGCQMAHATCLAAARYALLLRAGWNVEEDGLFGAPPIRVLTSTEKHGSFVRAVRLLGLGIRNIVELPTDSEGKLRRDALEEALASAPGQPIIVLLQAGDLNMGAYDDFAELIPLAKRFGAWVHIDGAFGLWAAASPQYRYLTEGMELADSWATDGHKWLNVPYDSGYAFVADAAAHQAAMSHRAAYLTHATEARDQMYWTPEWSRRARGFATYAALRELGRNGIANLIERTCAHAKALVAGIGTLPGAEILCMPEINQGLARFLDPRPGACDEDHDAWTDKVLAGVLASGEAFFTGTTWRGRRAMRVSVCNWQTSAADVERTCLAVKMVLQEMAGEVA